MSFLAGGTLCVLRLIYLLYYKSQFSDCKIEENTGFLKYVCNQDPSYSSAIKHKCPYSDEYYYIFRRKYFADLFSYETCSNDPHFYQACDKRLGGKVTNNELLCEHYLCSFGGYVFTPYLFSLLGKCNIDCKNTELNKVGCDDEKVALPTGELVRSSDICNNVCDKHACEDEATCNGYSYGMYCMTRYKKLDYVPPARICDGRQFCDGGEDEENCTVTSGTDTFCQHYWTGEIVPVHNYTRCMPVKKMDFLHNFNAYCALDDIAPSQTNCSDPTRVAVTCEIDGYLSTVSKYMICFDDEKSVCDDHIDSSCYSTKSCKVHKHLLCDGNMDCDDNADETHTICLKTTTGTCKRRIGTKNELPIPISWLRDGVRDCEDGTDETADWPMCGSDKTLRFLSSAESACKNVFICKSGDPGYELLEDLCDGIENCGNENEICETSRRSQSLMTKVSTTQKGQAKLLSFCHKGLAGLESIIGSCISKGFIYPDAEIFGVDTTSVILPQSKQSCDFMYGEQYLYTSCTGHCLEASCPLQTIPRYEVCPNQVPNRVGTIVNNEYLIFLTRSFGDVYTNTFFVCTNKIKCIDYSQVCNLVYDCEDGSDETQCTNHFQCSSSGKLLPKTKKCDGYIDCADLSDECNEQCSKKLLKGNILKGLSWLIGLLAIVANLVIIVKSLATLKRCKTSVALINRNLIVMIAVGDFLVGCYLFVIATYDAIIFKQDYCKKQISWITSFECSVIGVLSTIGSQISLFSMTGLSIVRIYGNWNSMKIPGEVTLMKVIKISAVTLSLILVSATIAVVPIVESFEDFFVNGVRFSDGLKIFIGTPDKAAVTGVIEAYHGRMKDATLRWKMLIEMVKEMFSHDFDYGDLTTRVEKKDFYGNDGVCLFKYFVQNQDPQKLFVWSTLALNFICFILISISYLFIGILSRRSSKSLASSENSRQIAKRNNRMNQRIAIIITTDFLCWVPFILICILHSLEVIDATPWYSNFSMIILPINSVINPLLYDDVVTNNLGVLARALKNQIYNSTIFQRFRQRASTEDKASAAPAEDIELQQRESTAPAEDIELQQRESTAPAEDIELQQRESTAPAEDIELQQRESTAPAEDIELQQRASTAPAEDIELQQRESTAPAEDIELPQRESTAPAEDIELPQRASPAPAEDIELQQRTSSAPAEDIELQQRASPAPAEDIELQQRESTAPAEDIELPQRESTAPAEDIELPQRASPAPAEDIELQQRTSSAPAEDIELQQRASPASAEDIEL